MISRRFFAPSFARARFAARLLVLQLASPGPGWPSEHGLYRTVGFAPRCCYSEKISCTHTLLSNSPRMKHDCD